MAKWLLQRRAISSADLDLYIYAIDTFIFSLLPILLALIIGIVLNMLLESILMILPFMLVRKFSGGFHLQSKNACLLWSSIFLSTILVIIKLSIAFSYIAMCTVLTVLSSLSLCFLSPIDSDKRRLSAEERKLFKRITCCLVFFVDVLYLAFCFLGDNRIEMSMGYGIFIPAILQIPCLKQKAVRRYIYSKK